MVIIQVAGGLGNQLRQYALYREYLNMGTEAKLDISWFQKKETEKKDKDNLATGRKLELAYFEGLQYEVCAEEEKTALIGSSGIKGKLKENFSLGPYVVFVKAKYIILSYLLFRDMYISGYFACERYYADILPDLRKQIKFPESNNPLNLEMAKEMENCQSVSMHIRRGDYLNAENAAMFGNICTEAYYEKAVEIVEENVKNPHFYIFSDDIPYVKEKYSGKQYTIIDINHGKDSFYDMWLMSRCKHNICANSTFSFWGARLNDNENKMMIRPTIHKNSQRFEKEKMEKLWEGWRFVSPEGNEE